MRKLLFILTHIAFVCTLHAQALYTTTLHGGTNGGGTICKLEQGKLTAAFNFDSPDGSHPSGKLLQASDGKLYGMTSGGGKFNVGTIFSFHPATGEYARLRDFDTLCGAYPQGSLIQAADGKLYGTARSGGTDDQGVIFSYDINKDNYTKLKDFDDDNGANPEGSLVQAANGNLYGITKYRGSYERGVVFSYNPLTHVYTKLTDFNALVGFDPTGDLLLARDGKLYGIAASGGGNSSGVLFSLDPLTGVYTKLKDLAITLGSRPVGNLIQAKNGKLYGVTYEGGRNDEGTIFSFDISTATFTKLQDFNKLTGSHPRGILLQAKNGKLYGITQDGGSTGRGVVFSFNPSTRKYKVEHIRGWNGGSYYINIIQASDGKLYGTTATIGSGNIGELFCLDITSSRYTKLRNFGISTLGYSPRGGLTKDSTGILYGTTSFGGRNGSGVIFNFNPVGAIYTKLKDLDNANGVITSNNLLYTKDGKLYGTTTWGGNSHGGTLFSFDPGTAVYTTLVEFTDSTTGTCPTGNLIQATNGKLYGMTNSGGSNWGGVIFSYDPATAIYVKLKDFSDSTGSRPEGGLIQISDGKLYGMTHSGGKHRLGVLFSFDIHTAEYTPLIDFDYYNGAHPFHGDLTQAMDGKLYGTTDNGGVYGGGVLFSYDITTHAYIKLNEFNGMQEKPVGRPTQAADGKLYGLWELRPSLDFITTGEQYNPGGVYSFDPVTRTYTKLQDFTNATGLHPKEAYFTEVAAPTGKKK